MSLYGKKGISTFMVLISWSFTALTTNLKAQSLGNSPYSSLGMGEFYGDAYSDNAGMGGSGVSTGSGFQINNLNPALWVRNRFTTLDIGLVSQYNDIKASSKSQQNIGGNLAYVSLSFPISPKWVLGINMKPYSFVDYENKFTRAVSGSGVEALYTTSGSGGVNKASITNSVQVGRYLSLGLESSYFFGNIRRTSEVSLSSQDYLVSLNERSTYSDIAFRAGAAAKIPISKSSKIFLNLGGAYSFSSSLNATKTKSFELTQSSFPVTDPDTLENNLGGSLVLPEQYQVGASLELPLKMTLSVDYQHQSWSKYRTFTNTKDNLKDVDRINAGLEFLPRFTSLNYFDLVRYRVGFSYGNTPYMVGQNNVKDASVSLGFTFPMGHGYQNFLSVAILGGQRGHTGGGMTRERYGRVVLGITLLERWFQKQKLN